MSSSFRTHDDDPREHSQLIFAIMDAQDVLAAAGIENPELGAIQEVLESRGIMTNIIEGSDGVPVIYRGHK